VVIGLVAFGCTVMANAQGSEASDTSPHHIRMVRVAPDVSLEVLDWGGTGKSIVLLAGLGMTAHSFDTFAPKLALSYHVYGITRRGLGKSSTPVPDRTNYSAGQLGNDVLAVMKALEIKRPVLAGHSFGGEELSFIGSRFPENVAGLIYLDAGYGYAFYSPTIGNLEIDSQEVGEALQNVIPGRGSLDQISKLQMLVDRLPKLQEELKEKLAEEQKYPPPGGKLPPIPPQMPAMLAGQQKFLTVGVPVLAIYAEPHALSERELKDPVTSQAKDAEDVAWVEPYIRTLQQAVPSARIVRLPHADHFVFRSNEDEVIREIRSFVNGLLQ
jgi:pimeloyl-ACP methyl ester carboxylesterase